jgi:hypothetical protein
MLHRPLAEAEEPCRIAGENPAAGVLAGIHSATKSTSSPSLGMARSFVLTCGQSEPQTRRMPRTPSASSLRISVTLKSSRGCLVQATRPPKRAATRSLGGMIHKKVS